MPTIPHQIAIYLESHGCHNVTPCMLTLGRDTYPAARYFQTLETLPHSQAYARGERRYTREMVMAVGMLPRHYCRSSHVAFTTPAEVNEWFIASHSGAVVGRKQVTIEPSDINPFGNTFILAPWNVANTKIDTYERTPYRRVAMSISPAA